MLCKWQTAEGTRERCNKGAHQVAGGDDALAEVVSEVLYSQNDSQTERQRLLSMSAAQNTCSISVADSCGAPAGSWL